MQPTEVLPKQLEARRYILTNIIDEPRVDGFTPCWIWQGRIDEGGYGTSKRGLGSSSAHRCSYMAFNGSIARRLQVDHLCYVRSCVNPGHLEAVTGHVNMMRAIAHDKALGLGHWARRERCASGRHAMDGDNVRVFILRGRECRQCETCRAEKAKAAYAKKVGRPVTPNQRAKGAGSVYFRASDSKWCGTIQLPSVDGRRMRKTFTAKTRAAAESKIEAFMSQAAA